MGKQKKNKDKDKKDKKKNKDRDRERDRQKKDKKKRDKKRSYSSSSDSSDDSSESSSSSREKTRKKENKIKKKDKKEVKNEVKSTNNPYDFEKTVPKGVPGFSVGLPTPGFSVPIMHPTPPPPMVNTTSAISKPKTKQINIFKLLPKLPYGSVLFAKTLYSSDLIQEKSYNKLLKQMIEQVDNKAKEQNSKKAITIVSKCSTQIQKIMHAEEERKRNLPLMENSGRQFLQQQDSFGQQNNRFRKLQAVYSQCFIKL